jgi:hypothetical protein
MSTDRLWISQSGLRVNGHPLKTKVRRPEERQNSDRAAGD